ncbi:hypothetical protein GQ457_16G020510 [Hibiscus cannabinus]
MDLFDPKLETMGVIRKRIHKWLLMESKLPNSEESYGEEVGSRGTPNWVEESNRINCFLDRFAKPLFLTI